MSVSTKDTEAEIDSIAEDELLAVLEEYCKDVRDFKAYFIRNCSVDKKYEAYKIWSHWLIRNLCLSQDNYHIIPKQSIIDDPDILAHLQEKGANPQTINEFYNQIVQRTSVLYNRYHQFKIDQIQDPKRIELVSKAIQYTVYYDKGNKYHVYRLKETYIKHNDLKHRKLLKLYNGEPKHLNFYMFESGFNYYILDGHSLQWCIPPKVFETLKLRLGVKTELFASPMNSHLPLYCSLFYIDKQFGALDNFFNLDPKQVLEGTFEVNPPFIEQVFIQSSAMVLGFLDQSEKMNKDLAFIYVMPDWIDSQGYAMLTQSKYLVDELVFEENKHFYYQASNDRMVSANFKSRILITGTTASKARWTTKVKNEIITGFCHYERKPWEGHPFKSISQL